MTTSRLLTTALSRLPASKGLSCRSSLCRLALSRWSHSTRPESITIHWVLKDGSQVSKPAAVGDTLLQAAHRHGLPVEGACEGVCACSTCHVLLDSETFDSLPEASETEEDMLDQAFGLTATSRLGCQVVLTEALDGITVRLPRATRNFYVVR